MAEVPLYFMIGSIFPGNTSGAWIVPNGNSELWWHFKTELLWVNTGLYHPARIWNYVGVTNVLVSIATGGPTTITWTDAHGHPIGSQFEVNITGVTGAAPSELLNRRPHLGMKTELPEVAPARAPPGSEQLFGY